MDVFGSHWRDHAAAIERSWRQQVAPSDLVLIAGDISWAMRLPEVGPDLAWIDQLPGRKVLCKGNHDYWWNSRSRARSVLPPSLDLVDCDALRIDDVVICGTRGWIVPGDRDFQESSDRRIYERELARLERALAGARLLAEGRLPIVAMLHFPPFRDGEPTAFADMLASAGVRSCVYGHLHQAEQWATAVSSEVAGVCYHLTACDALGFQPLRLECLTPAAPAESAAQR